MQKLFYSFVLVICFGISMTSHAQRHEYGGGVGLLNYSGEINPFPNPLNSRPGAQLLYRLNCSPAFSLRINIMGGLIHGSEKNGSSPVAKNRQAAFNSTVFDFCGIMEYNFLDYWYKETGQQHRLSPYFAAGLGAMNYQTTINGLSPDGSNTVLCMPIGGGIKYRLAENLNMNVELIARKAFTDKLDGIYDPKDPNVKNTANSHTSDWYYYLGFNLTYTVFKVNCPEHL